MALKDDLGRVIRRHRERMGLTQQQVGEAVGLTTQAIGNIERGKSLPTLRTLEAIARTLKTPIRDLFPIEQTDSDLAQKVAVHLAGLAPEDRAWFEGVVTALLRQPGR